MSMHFLKFFSLLFASLLLFSCEELVPGMGKSNGGEITEGEQKTDIYSKLGKHFEQSMQQNDKNIEQLLEQMEDKSNEKPQLTPIYNAARSISETGTSELSKLVDEFCLEIQEKTLNFQSNVNSKSIPKDILADTDLSEIINQTREVLFKYLDDLIQQNNAQPMRGVRFKPQAINQLKEEFALSPVKSKAWMKDNFGGLTASASYALLRKYQNDAKNAKLQILQYLSTAMNSKVLVYDRFMVLSSSEKPYILRGETFESTISIGGYSSQVDYTAKVNGEKVPVVNGKTLYKHQARTIGTQSYTVEIAATNPLTGEVIRSKKDFTYEVAASAAGVFLDKMNVIYMGVDNPISISAAGISPKDLKVSISGGGNATISKVTNGKYTIKANSPSSAGNNCTINIQDRRSKKKLASFEFRVKRIPNPVAKLITDKTDGLISAGEMKTQRGIMASLENFDFDARCSIQSFTLYYVPSRQDPVELKNTGGRFSGQVMNAIQAAKPGTAYHFINIKGRCPGDKAGRLLNSLAFLVR